MIPSSNPTGGSDSELRAMLRFGLARAIQVHSEQVRARYPHLQLRLDLVDDENLLPERVAFGLFRVYQEALANIERHAEAGAVSVRYYPDGEQMALEIHDDGRGFSIPEDWARFTRGAGVMGMKRRIEELGGALRIESEPGAGTRIHASVPLGAPGG